MSKRGYKKEMGWRKSNKKAGVIHGPEAKGNSIILQ